MCRMSVKCEWSLQNISTIFSEDEHLLCSLFFALYAHIILTHSGLWQSVVFKLSVHPFGASALHNQSFLLACLQQLRQELCLWYGENAPAVCAVRPVGGAETQELCACELFQNSEINQWHNDIVSTELFLLETVIMKKSMGIISQHLFMYCICLMWKKHL